MERQMEIGMIFIKGRYVYLVPFFPSVPRAYGKLAWRFKVVDYGVFYVDGVGEVEGLEKAIKACMSDEAELLYPPKNARRHIYLWPKDSNIKSIASRIRYELTALGYEP
jgi:hypothetical protein